MSISYHGVIGHTAKVTLPAVKSWSTNNNILRAPPKAVFTRRNDKVQQTSRLVNDLANGSDRMTDQISVYSQGINPMVSISYNNATGPSAYLPHRIMKDGAFRAPQIAPTDLLPLSRKVRPTTEASGRVKKVRYNQRIFDQDQTTKDIRENMTISVRPSQVLNLPQSVIEPYEVKNIIHNPTVVNVNTQKSNLGQFNGQYESSNYAIAEDPLHSQMNVNKKAPQRDIDIRHFNTDSSTKDQFNVPAMANRSHHTQVMSLEELYDGAAENHFREQPNISYQNGKTTYTRDSTDHRQLQELERSLPEHQTTTAISDLTKYHNPVKDSYIKEYTANKPQTSTVGTRRVNKHSDFQTRTQHLRPTVSGGSFQPNIGAPSTNRNVGVSLNTAKSQMRQQVLAMQQRK